MNIGLFTAEPGDSTLCSVSSGMFHSVSVVNRQAAEYFHLILAHFTQNYRDVPPTRSHVHAFCAEDTLCDCVWLRTFGVLIVQCTLLEPEAVFAHRRESSFAKLQKSIKREAVCLGISFDCMGASSCSMFLKKHLIVFFVCSFPANAASQSTRRLPVTLSHLAHIFVRQGIQGNSAW